MAGSEIKDENVRALFAEVAATKLILRVLIESLLPANEEDAWKEVEALIARVDQIAKSSKVGATTSAESRRIVDTAAQIATDFIRPIGPKPVRQ